MFNYLLIFFLALCSASINADDYSSPIEDASQIYGCYQRIIFEDRAMNNMNTIEPYPVPYQWYCFYENDKFWSLHSSKEMPITEVLAMMDMQSSVEDYSVIRKGLIFIHHKEARQKSQWVTSLITKSIRLWGVEIERGDILMTLRVKGKDIYYRFLRKVK